MDVSHQCYKCSVAPKHDFVRGKDVIRGTRESTCRASRDGMFWIFSMTVSYSWC